MFSISVCVYGEGVCGQNSFWNDEFDVIEQSGTDLPILVVMVFGGSGGGGSRMRFGGIGHPPWIRLRNELDFNIDSYLLLKTNNNRLLTIMLLTFRIINEQILRWMKYKTKTNTCNTEKNNFTLLKQLSTNMV